jgi:hypothetical protein
LKNCSLLEQKVPLSEAAREFVWGTDAGQLLFVRKYIISWKRDEA